VTVVVSGVKECLKFLVCPQRMQRYKISGKGAADKMVCVCVCVCVACVYVTDDVQGSVRRKKKVVVREHGNDEKKIQSVLKKIGLSEIPSIDEVVHM